MSNRDDADGKTVGFNPGGVSYFQEPASISGRAHDFLEFADLVVSHIDQYTVPQYGDKPNDPVESWTAQQCVDCIQRYISRHGTNVRGKEEVKRDLLKVAHYAQLAYDRL